MLKSDKRTRDETLSCNCIVQLSIIHRPLCLKSTWAWKNPRAAITLGSRFSIKRFKTRFICRVLDQQILSWRGDKVQFGVSCLSCNLTQVSLLSPELPLGGEYSCLDSNCSLYLSTFTLCPFRGALPDRCQTHLQMVIIVMTCAWFILAGTHPQRGHISLHDIETIFFPNDLTWNNIIYYYRKIGSLLGQPINFFQKCLFFKVFFLFL